jgi:alanine racemase
LLAPAPAGHDSALFWLYRPAVESADPPLRLTVDAEALAHNWRLLARASGQARCGAAVKANGYGLGARRAVDRLAAAGCRDFFVATWAEAAALAPWPEGLRLSVLHGVRDEDMRMALAGPARPVLSTARQIRRWRASGGGPCDAMVDTGINRLGVTVEEVRNGVLNGLTIDTLMSHLACADEDSAANDAQLRLFGGLRERFPSVAMSLANSAGIALGEDFHFDLTRPGLAIYGGVPRAEMASFIRQVARIDVQVLQRRRVPAGERVGYGGTYLCTQPTELAIVNIGYADGYLRAFSGRGYALAGNIALPVVGRVSMDLTAVRVDDAPEIVEGEWLEIAFDLRWAAETSGLSQYELLTTLGRRYLRRWT